MLLNADMSEYRANGIYFRLTCEGTYGVQVGQLEPCNFFTSIRFLLHWTQSRAVQRCGRETVLRV